MSAWSNFMLRLRLLGRSILRSEEHLGALPGVAAQLDRLARATETTQQRNAATMPAVQRLTEVTEKTERHLAMIAGIMAQREIVGIMSDARFDHPLRLERSGFKVHSEYDEDGIIDEIFRRIGTTNRTFVEFGAGNGTENCTGFLLMQGWRGLWLDGSDAFLRTVNISWKAELARDQLVACQAFLTVDTIDQVIGDAGFSGEIDLLSVDIDGNDYHILEKIGVVSPRVICAEYNANIPPHIDWKMARKDDYVWEGLDDRTGASLKALENMLGRRGYALVGCGVAGVNAFFVRRDLVAGKFAEPFTAENHYNPWRFFYRAPGAVSNWREGSVRR